MITGREYSYQEFTDYARRFSQEGLLTGIAQAALTLPPTGAPDPRYRRMSPWALAAVAKASICHGNRYRSVPVRRDTVPDGCFMYNNIRPEELGQDELKTPFGILLRLAYEQFPGQESPYEEVARAGALFECYSGRKELEVLGRQGLAELLGAPLQQALAVGFLLFASANVNEGFFNPKWMDQPNFSEVLAIVPRQDITSVIDAVFATDFDGFRRQADKAPAQQFLDRYAFNPLTSRPFVRLRDGRLLAPVPQLVPRKLSPGELYYLGLERWGGAFSRDMGELFEDYVGRQLRTLPGVTVYPEIRYAEGKDTVMSVDWIVVSPDSVLLVEAKATRVPAAARAGQENAQESFKRTLGKAFDQISRTHQAISEGRPEFLKIPQGLPVHGLVATLDSWYIANSPLARDLLPQPGIPTLVASARCLEHLVAIGQRRPATQVLAEIIGDAERRTWDLGTALQPYAAEEDDNPLLRAAWERYLFDSEVPGQGSRGSARPADARSWRASRPWYTADLGR